jgi:hypothetical protein
MFSPVAGEAMAIEAAEPIKSTEPQEAARIPVNSGDVVVRQAVGDRVSLDRQPLGWNDGGRGQKDAKQKGDAKTALLLSPWCRRHTSSSRRDQERQMEFDPVEDSSAG